MKPFIFFAIVALYAFFAFEPPRTPVDKNIVHAAEAIMDPWVR